MADQATEGAAGAEDQAADRAELGAGELSAAALVAEGLAAAKGTAGKGGAGAAAGQDKGGQGAGQGKAGQGQAKDTKDAAAADAADDAGDDAGDDGASLVELKKLRAELAELKAGQDAVQQKRIAQDAQDSFIRTYVDGLPPEMMRRLLPETTDKMALLKAAKQVDDWVQAIISEYVERGLVKRISIEGGSPKTLEGATSLMGFKATGKESASELVLMGLRQRGR